MRLCRGIYVFSLIFGLALTLIGFLLLETGEMAPELNEASLPSWKQAFLSTPSASTRRGIAWVGFYMPCCSTFHSLRHITRELARRMRTQIRSFSLFHPESSSTSASPHSSISRHPHLLHLVSLQSYTETSGPFLADPKQPSQAEATGRRE